MKQKIKWCSHASAVAWLVASCFFIGGSSLTEAQGVHPFSANTSSDSGQWNPPSQAKNHDESRSTGWALDPPAGTLQPIKRRKPPESYPLQSQKPAMLTEQPLRARPLQPMKQNNILQGAFAQEAKPGSEFARVNHHEASTVEGVMPLPRVASNWPNNGIPKTDLQTETAWPEALENAEDAGAESGIVGSFQGGIKNVLSGFQSEGGWGEKVAGLFGAGDDRFKKVFGSLAIVIGGYLGFVWLMRKFNISTSRGIPSEVIEVIGNAPFGPRKNLQLVRLGSKLLLLMNGPEGTHPVGEITDTDEVDYLISLCKGKRFQAKKSVASAVQRFAGRHSKASPGTRTNLVQATNSPVADGTFSTSQLVEALQAIQNSNQPNTVFEA